MKPHAKTIALGFSLACNALCAALLALALSAPAASLSYFKPDGQNLTAAALASVPASGSVVFNTVEITLKKHDQAALQFSFVAERGQANLLINALYDPAVIAVEPSGYGVVITALAEGETIMQTLANDGIRDVALVRVQP